jgi:hypothetical protein
MMTGFSRPAKEEKPPLFYGMREKGGEGRGRREGEGRERAGEGREKGGREGEEGGRTEVKLISIS